MARRIRFNMRAQSKGDTMTDAKTLLEQAARCRRIARVCTTATIARKLEALARDYEEHARQLPGSSGDGHEQPSIELREPRSGRPTALGAAQTRNRDAPVAT
jgi:hypothetical protein